jgi:hypothetical protein
MKFLRRPGETPVPEDGHKNAQVVDVHGEPTNYSIPAGLARAGYNILIKSI